MRLGRIRRLIGFFLDFPAAARGFIAALVLVVPLALLLTGGTLELLLVLVSTAVLGASALFAYSRLLKGGNSRGYEILAQEHEWDLMRADGSLAIHRKQLKVRYLNQVMSV